LLQDGLVYSQADETTDYPAHHALEALGPFTAALAAAGEAFKNREFATAKTKLEKAIGLSAPEIVKASLRLAGLAQQAQAAKCAAEAAQLKDEAERIVEPFAGVEVPGARELQEVLDHFLKDLAYQEGTGYLMAADYAAAAERFAALGTFTDAPELLQR